MREANQELSRSQPGACLTRRSDAIQISVVIPVYGSRACLEELHRRLVASLSTITPHFEIVLVNDACPENSWQTIKQLALKDKRVKAVDLSRNFGQIRAITAGLEFATGQWIVVMDCDLQDRPEEIIKLYGKAQEGYDVVFSRRAARKDKFFKRLWSQAFYAIYRYFSAGVFDSSISNFSISRYTVMKNYMRMGDRNRAFIMFIKWMGFRTTTVDVVHAERASGKSAYNMRKQLRLAFEIITTQSNKPLVLSIKLGLSVAAIAFLYGMYLIVGYLFYGKSIQGWTSIIVSIYFIGGVILVQLGILGLYLGLVFDQTKHRPLYIVREVIEDGISSLGTS
jgi:glycosyltransferase involved in cell wall biosynthesis